jgi:hypothetical protein
MNNFQVLNKLGKKIIKNNYNDYRRRRVFNSVQSSENGRREYLRPKKSQIA